MNPKTSSITIGQITSISDPQRVTILRELMKKAATLSQLGDTFQVSAAHVRHHLKILEAAGLVELVDVRPVRGCVEKYYRATSSAFLVQYTILPDDQSTLLIGSMDFAVSHLADRLADSQPAITPLVLSLSSLDGLISLRQGVCQIVSCHLIDPETGEYNLPYLRRLFSDQRMALVHLFNRTEGLIVQPGNPLSIRHIDDLVRGTVRLANREPGSGVRTWLDLALRQRGVSPEMIAGYALIAPSHFAAAKAVWEGNADVTIGILPAARQYGLDFVPLLEEPYDLVLSENTLRNPLAAPLFEAINSPAVMARMMNTESTEGYHLSPSLGKTTWVN